jgi:hypothetical protein
VARTDPISPSELYSQLLSFEQHVSLQAHQMSGSCSSTMAPTRGRVSSGGRGYGSYDRGRGRVAQVVVTHQMEAHHGHRMCLKFGHTVNNCWHRFEKDYVPEQRTLAATSSTGADPAWYMDLGATDHITSDLDHFTMHDPYTGHDQVHAANGSGMGINRIGTSIIPTTTRPLTLTNVLHVPSVNKNFISVHRFTLDNDTFIEFYPYFFLIKYRQTKKVLLHGQCKGGLYPLPPSTSKFLKLVFNAIKISIDH